jgi:predicted protein tyrosine phosphatase
MSREAPEDTPPFAITVCGIDELDGHGAIGVSHVLSILDPDHPVPEAFGAFGEHVKRELRFHDIIEDTPGHVLPRPGDVDAILALGRSLQSEPAGTRHLLVHCHAGISRSTAAMVLILAQALPQRSAEDIVRMVHGIREKAWPNLRLMEMGDAALGRRGSLLAATHALHRLQMERRPRIVALMENDGRGREIALARQVAPLAEG